MRIGANAPQEVAAHREEVYVRSKTEKDDEPAGLDTEIVRITGEVEGGGGKLSNAGFVDKAPAEVIEKERAKLAEAEQALGKLAEQHARIASL
ncbi:hypothetical protein B1218_32975, partial [Pseudomonas ogarae]